MSGSGERQAKLRRLFAPGNVPHRQIEQLLARLREEDVVQDVLTVDRKQLGRANDSLVKTLGQKEHLAQVLGGDFDWWTASLPRLLQTLASKSRAWAEEFSVAFERQPCSQAAPFHLLVYTDEATPGNVLRLDNRRKMAAVYLTIKEFRPEVVKHSDMWVPIACIRSTIVKTIDGGLSACIRTLYRRWLLEEGLGERGVLLELPGGRVVNIYLAAGPLLADGEALRAVWNGKGAAGKLPCLLCKNLVNDDEAAANSSYLVPLSCSDAKRFDLMEDQDFWEKADTLREKKATETKGVFNKIQMAMGITFCPSGLLWDESLRRHLRPRSVISFDAMHCVLSNGVGQNEMSYLLTELAKHSVGWREFRLFVATNWQTSRASGSPSELRECFSASRERICKDSGKFPCSASELLMVFPVMEHFLETVIVPKRLCMPHVASFRALGALQRSIRGAKEGECSAGDLELAIARHAAAFQGAYGLRVKPKNHYLMHLPLQVARDGVLFDCFVGERKHIELKKAAEAVRNTEQMEKKTTLFRCLAAQLERVSDPVYLTDRLMSPKVQPELATSLNCREAHLSTTMCWHGTTVGAGDAIWLEARAHVVRACGSLDGVLHLLVLPHTFVEQAF